MLSPSFLFAEKLPFILKIIYLFTYFWLGWVFVALHVLSLAVAIMGSVVVVHGLHCSTIRGVFPVLGSNPCPRVDRQILNHWATGEVE